MWYVLPYGFIITFSFILLGLIYALIKFLIKLLIKKYSNFITKLITTILALGVLPLTIWICVEVYNYLEMDNHNVWFVYLLLNKNYWFWIYNIHNFNKSCCICLLSDRKIF